MRDGLQISSTALWGLPIAFLVLGMGMFVTRWVRIRRRSSRDPEEVLLGAVSHSLQERGQLAASLGELRTVHEVILDALPMGILWTDQHRRFKSLNAAGRRLLGVKPGVVGLDAAFVLEPFPWLQEGLDRKPGESWRCDGRGRRWQVRRIQSPDRLGALIQFEDVTELESEERRRSLRDRFAELGEMTAGVAHQMKNGLAVLKGRGQLLARAGHGEAARELLLETEDLERLVQRFLQWAKPLDPRCVETDLEEAVRQAVSELQRRPVIQGRSMEIHGSGHASADPLLLHQALVNLLENACQVTPSGGVVRLRVQESRIEILDEGPGLGEESLARMLRPFESGRPEGTGLGLPLALKWLNAQGADLRFEKRSEGGTRVTVAW